jgi:hypothetical protein
LHKLRKFSAKSLQPVTIEVPNDGQHNDDDDDDDDNEHDSNDNDDDHDDDCDDATVPSVRRTILECSELLQLSIRSLTV